MANNGAAASLTWSLGKPVVQDARENFFLEPGKAHVNRLGLLCKLGKEKKHSNAGCFTWKNALLPWCLKDLPLF